MDTPLAAFQQHRLFKFLHDHPYAKGKEVTMTGMGEIQGKWSIPDSEYPELLNLLNDYLFVQGKRALGFVEQPRTDKEKPLLIDLDFHYKKEKALDIRTFDKSHILSFCQTLQEGLNYFFDMAATHDSIRYFVTLRQNPYDAKDKIKDGLHILSPDVTLTNDKWNVLRRHTLAQNKVRDVFGPTGYMNPDDAVYDEAMGRKQGWMFYGASKPSIPAYKLAHVFTYDPEADAWGEEPVSNYTSRELLELMSIRYKVDDDIEILREERKEEFEALLKPAAPAMVEAATTGIDTVADMIPGVNALLSMLPTSEDDLKVIRAMVMECLSEDRAMDHDGWMRVGWCLHNIAANEDMFDLWMAFTKERCPSKWDSHRSREQAQLRREWFHGMRKDGDGPRLGIRSLYKWARDDNLERYKQIIDEDTSEFIIRQTDATHYHIARLMKKMYGSIYIASVNSRSTEWYYYDEGFNMWRHLNQGMELRQKVCLDVADQIQSACDKISARWSQSRNEDDRKRYAEKQKQLHDMQVKLYNSGFCESVMKMCSILFYEEDFMNKLNINPFLFGCANGVLELRHKAHEKSPEKVIFRQGRPEDYVSFLAGRNFPETESIRYIPYSEFVKAKDPRLEEIRDFFEKLFPRPDLRKHVMKILASCLEGCNREQLYYFFIGVGSNGKSKLITLMKWVLGDYQTSLATTALTRKRPESGAANPDIIACKCRRFIYSQEPDDKEPLNSSRMKQLSGEDMVEARGLFQDQEKFKIMGKMFMMCNRLPPVNSLDNGTWRRLRVILFESRFEPEDHPDLLAGKPHVYPRDNFLDEKMMRWREPFLALLVHIYETEYIPKGLSPEPAVIKQESEKYKADHDCFAKFRMERIRERRDGYEEVTNNSVSLKDIFKCYKRWAESAGAKRTDMNELEKRCEDAFGDSRGKKVYTHIRVFLEEEEVEEFDRLHSEDAEAEEH